MALKNCKECNAKVSTLAKTCPHCGVPKPTNLKLKKSNLKTKVKKKTIKPWGKPSKDKIWVHCSNRRCRDYTQMYQIYESYLGIDHCNLCRKKFKKAETENGKPIMPSGGNYASSTTSTSYENNQTSNSSSSTKTSDGAWEKFLDGKLDLAAAFWGFGVFGSLIVGLICGFLTEAVGSFFIFAYIVATIAIISGLWQCADTHKKNMTAEKQSTVWGVLAQAYCVLGGLGLINFIIEYLK